MSPVRIVTDASPRKLTSYSWRLYQNSICATHLPERIVWLQLSGMLNGVVKLRVNEQIFVHWSAFVKLTEENNRNKIIVENDIFFFRVKNETNINTRCVSYRQKKDNVCIQKKKYQTITCRNYCYFYLHNTCNIFLSLTFNHSNIHNYRRMKIFLVMYFRWLLLKEFSYLLKKIRILSFVKSKKKKNWTVIMISKRNSLWNYANISSLLP